VLTVDCLHSCKALADFFQCTWRTNDEMESVPSKCASNKLLRTKKKRKEKVLHFSFVSHDSGQVAYHEKKGKD
jgi:hypothetical protein